MGIEQAAVLWSSVKSLCEQLTALGEETLFLSVNVKEQHTAYFGSDIGKTFMKNNQLLHLLYQDSLARTSMQPMGYDSNYGNSYYGNKSTGFENVDFLEMAQDQMTVAEVVPKPYNHPPAQQRIRTVCDENVGSYVQQVVGTPSSSAPKRPSCSMIPRVDPSPKKVRIISTTDFTPKKIQVDSNKIKNKGDTTVVSVPVGCPVPGVKKLVPSKCSAVKIVSVPHAPEVLASQYSVCHDCSKVYKWTANLKLHYRESHYKVFFCGKCKAGFQTQLHMDSHSCTSQEGHKHAPTRLVNQMSGLFEDERSKLLSCAKCSIRFGTNNLFQAHIHSQQHEVGLPYTCIMCCDSFDNNSKLQKHYESLHNICNINVTKEIESPGKKQTLLQNCRICSKEFQGREILAEHYRIQHQKLAMCINCNIGFNTRDDLDLHVQNMKLRNKSDVYRCHDCCKHFKNKLRVRNHYQNNHNKGVFCEICTLAFRTDDQLKEHVCDVPCDVKKPTAIKVKKLQKKELVKESDNVPI